MKSCFQKGSGDIEEEFGQWNILMFRNENPESYWIYIKKKKINPYAECCDISENVKTTKTTQYTMKIFYVIIIVFFTSKSWRWKQPNPDKRTGPDPQAPCKPKYVVLSWSRTVQSRISRMFSIQFQLADRSHELILEITALRAKVAEMREMIMTMDQDIREEVRRDYQAS